MNRRDREITDINRMEAILKQCGVCRLALNDEGAPYIVPLSVGYAREGDRFFLYFHQAKIGKKLDLMRKNPHVAFEMDAGYEVIPSQRTCGYTARFQSLMGRGTLTEVTGEEAAEGLRAILRQCGVPAPGEITESMLNAVVVTKLTVETMTGKANV